MTTQNSSGSASSDMSFYVIMLGIIVGMAFYISSDIEKRYGSAETAQTVVDAPVVISVAETDSVMIKPIADIPATDTTPEAVIVKKIEQKTIVTTALVPVKEAAAAEVPVAEPAPVSILETMINTVEQAAAPIVETVAEVVQPEPEVVSAASTEPSSDAYNAYQQGYRDGFTKGYQKASRQQYGNPYNNNNNSYPYQQ